MPGLIKFSHGHFVLRALGSAALCALCWAAPALSSHTANALELTPPVKCRPQAGCNIQNYVDVDPGPDARSFACTGATYDGHKGTDFRTPPARIGRSKASVVASAPGIVHAMRDGMSDSLKLTNADRIAIKGKECGNGVVIAHARGWTTQYCHMQRGSVSVRKGDVVARGQKLGVVGLSGDTAFYHVHLVVRKGRRVIDPFLGRRTRAGCVPEIGHHRDVLWARRTIPGVADKGTRIFQAGFSEQAVSQSDLELLNIAPFTATSSAAVFFANWLHLRKGDRVITRLKGPGGLEAETASPPADTFKAQFRAFIGKKRRSKSWPRGTYIGETAVIRDDRVLRGHRETFELK